MVKKTISYTDYNGNERTEDFYFNLSPSELFRMETSRDSGMSSYLKKISASNDAAEIYKVFEEIIFAAYGEKSEDGKTFIKNEEVKNKFSQSAAYDAMLIEFVSDVNKASDFVNSLIPKLVPEG